MDGFFDSFAAMPLHALIPVLALTTVIYFLPIIVAVFRNRANLGKIALVNVPAGMSWIAWTALLVWAASGKGTEAMPRTNINWGWALAGLVALIVVVTVALGRF